MIVKKIFVRKAWLSALLSAFFCLYASSVPARFSVCEPHPPSPVAAEVDSVSVLKELIVADGRYAQSVRSDSLGSISLSARGLTHGLRSLGEADGLRALLMLPAFSCGSDYGSGVSVKGCEIANVGYFLDGAPVFFPFHFGGIFSVFNPSSLARFDVRPVDLQSGFRLGDGIYAHTPDYIPQSIVGSFNLGLLASSLSARVPVGASTALGISARVSYINALYSPFLKYDGSAARYGFEDVNIGVLHNFDAKNSLKISFMANDDRVDISEQDFTAAMGLDWSNLVGSARFSHAGSRNADLVFAYSQMRSAFEADMSQMGVRLPSMIRQISLSGACDVSADRSWTAAFRAEYTHFRPQSVKSYGLLQSPSAVPAAGAWLFSLGGGKKIVFANGCSIDAQCRMAVNASDSKYYYAIDPCLSLARVCSSYSWHVGVAGRTQFIHQVGLSDIGVAANFWLPSAFALKPQRSFGIDVGAKWFDLVKGVNVSAQAYVADIRRSPQFTASLIDVLSGDYSPYAYVSESLGYNVGGDITADFSLSRLSGWVGYGVAVCRRRFNADSRQWFASANEPLHSFKVFADWRLSDNLSVSAFFSLASGRPFTPVEAIYLIGSNIIAEYGPYNSARLPLYHKLDVSATLFLPRLRLGAKSLANFINLSMLNVYGHKNVEMQYFTYDEVNNTIRLRQVHSLYRFLPSVSYTVEF